MTRSTRAPLGLVLAAALAVASCGTGNQGSPGASPAGGSPDAGAASAAASGPAVSSPSASVAPSGSSSPSASASASPAADEFTNPVIDANFADPFILPVDGTYYAYATGDLSSNIQVSTSPDLVTWTDSTEALPKLPLWEPVSKGLTWAPEVVKADGKYVMHYTTRDVQAGKQCLSAAVADDPAGPFVDDSQGPLECQTKLGGSIDSSPFRDKDGSLWLVWKNDGNCCGIHTRFFIAPLDETGTKLTGKAKDLGLDNDRAWEGNVIEAPQILLHDGTYYLFYSANDYGSSKYAIGYATSKQLEGPYKDAPENPIVVSKGDAAGPGHETIVTAEDGELWMAYHAWDASLIGDSAGGRRAMWLDRLEFKDGKPVVTGPTEDPQPLP
jgi:beta-xylosidase